MRGHGFGRGVLFAAAAAAVWPAVWLAAGPLLGGSAALSLYLLAAATVYGAGIAPRAARGAPAGLLAAVIGSAFLAATRDPQVVALGAALAIGVCRSGLSYAARPGRAIAGEVTLLGAGLLLARLVAAPGPLGAALAIWSFFLVQSTASLIGGVRERARRPGVDPFEEARRRTVALLASEEDAGSTPARDAGTRCASP